MYFFFFKKIIWWQANKIRKRFFFSIHEDDEEAIQDYLWIFNLVLSKKCDKIQDKIVYSNKSSIFSVDLQLKNGNIFALRKWLAMKINHYYNIRFEFGRFGSWNNFLFTYIHIIELNNTVNQLELCRWRKWTKNR